ncbi:MAG: hypothetical protein K2O32_11535 [Acetatifactor sp.]|nr:hypothetical protein [Acetatifactor sp.]
MKNRTKYSLYVLLFGILLSVSGCGAENTDNSKTGTEEPELRTFLFQSADEAEAISDEDLIYIAQNKYKTSDFISDIDSGVYDLFDTPLMEKKVDGVLYRESVEPYILQSKLPLSKVDINEEISDEVFQELIDEHCTWLIEATNTWNGTTGSRTKDEEIIYCGENDYYVEYSIRYTELRTYYQDDILVTHEIPRAYRRCFLKNELSVKNWDSMELVYFGELSLERGKAIGDFYGFVNSRPSIYRDVQETDSAYVDTNYLIYIIGGDYGVRDVAELMRVDKYYDKITHEITSTSTTIKSVEMPGTNVIYGK